MIDPPCRACPLRSLPVIASSSPEEIDFIQSLKRGQVAFPVGAQIIAEGANDASLYTLFSGWAFRFKTLRDGRRQILNFLLPGDFIGLQQKLAKDSPHGVEALTDTVLCVFPRNGLWELHKQHPSLGYDVTWLAAHEESMVDDNLLTVGRRTAEERVAVLLINLYKRAEGLKLVTERGVLFPVTQQHIADALGLSLVHTNKTLRKLQRLGLHDVAGGYLTIRNIGVLRRIADYYEHLPSTQRPLI